MPGTGFPSRNNNILGQQDRYPGAPGWAYRACGQLLDIPHIWCILTRLFMRSIIAPVLVNVIGQRVIGLGRYRLSKIISLSHKVLKFFHKFSNNIGWLSPGQDLRIFYKI